MKIGFYIQFYTDSTVDLTSVDKGNLGFGGTQFCFSYLIYNLSRFYTDIEIIVYSDTRLILPRNCVGRVVGLNTLLQMAKDDQVRILILKTPFDLEFYSSLAEKFGVDLICWSHNYFNANVAEAISRCSQVKAVVFVSKQMYDFYYDNDIIHKATFIYNAIPNRSEPMRVDYKPYTAVYMGSIIRQKGIIELMKIWTIVEKKYPQAELQIIGSGKLYDKKTKLGKFNIADEGLEKDLESYICTPEGELKSNIHFLGLMGEEKYDVFSRSAVGIVNPSANTETFGMGIIEMASVGLPVVTRGWNGHLDTVINKKTGLTAYSIRGMAKQVMRLFKDDRLNRNLGQEAKKRMSLFSAEKITAQWYSLLCNIASNSIAHRQLPLSKPYWNNYKLIRGVVYFFRQKLGLRFVPSVVDVETYANNMLKKLRK